MYIVGIIFICVFTYIDLSNYEISNMWLIISLVIFLSISLIQKINDDKEDKGDLKKIIKFIDKGKLKDEKIEKKII